MTRNVTQNTRSFWVSVFWAGILMTQYTCPHNYTTQPQSGCARQEKLEPVSQCLETVHTSVNAINTPGGPQKLECSITTQLCDLFHRRLAAALSTLVLSCYWAVSNWLGNICLMLDNTIILEEYIMNRSSPGRELHDKLANFHSTMHIHHNALIVTPYTTLWYYVAKTQIL